MGIGSYLWTDGVGSYLDATGATVPVREDLAATWDTSVTKTNIGTGYVDIYTATGAAAKAIAVDCEGKTQARVTVLWNKVGTGTQTLKVCDAGDPTKILHEFTNLASGENDSGLITLPVWFAGERRTVKLMAASSVGTDDPVFEGARVYVR